MNREQKAAAIEEIAEDIRASQAVFAVDYRGLSVPQAAELRAKLREADASFRVVKNTLTERAADQAEASTLKDHLTGPTALAFVRGDAAAAAKALADYQKDLGGELLPFKGGLLDGNAVDAAEIVAISKLPSRQQLYQQLVGMVAFPVSGLARTLNQLIGGLAVALGDLESKVQSGEVTLAAGAPAAAAAEAPAVDAVPGSPADDSTDIDAEAPVPAASSEDPAEGSDTNSDETPQED